MISKLLKQNSIGQSIRQILINMREFDKTQTPVGKFNALVSYSYLANHINKFIRIQGARPSTRHTVDIQ